MAALSMYEGEKDYRVPLAQELSSWTKKVTDLGHNV